MILFILSSRLHWVSIYLIEALLGNVTFSFLFRRPLLAVLQRIFSLSAGAESRSKLQSLSREAAGELVLAALLLPVDGSLLSHGCTETWSPGPHSPRRRKRCCER